MTNTTATKYPKSGNKGGVTVENFKQINKCDVWTHLQTEKKVFAVIFKSRAWRTGLKELWHDWNVNEINRLLFDKEKDIVFFEEIEEVKKE